MDSSKHLVVAIAILLCFCSTLFGDPRAASKELEEALKAKYQITKTGFDRLRITQPGTVLVVQKDGISANRSTEAGMITSKVIDGNVQGPQGLGGAFFEHSTDKSLKAGTNVYVTRIWVRDKEVRFDIITCDTEDINMHGNTREMRYAAAVAFQFPDGFSDSVDANAIKKIVDAVLLPQSEVQSGQSKTVSLGQTEEQVKAILGAPDKIVNLGATTKFFYKDMKVTFTDGKVTDVE